MTVYDFVVTVADLDFNSDTENLFRNAGCNDAVIMLQHGDIVLDFSRTADSLQQAVDSALLDISKVGGTIIKYEFVSDQHYQQD